MSFQDDVSTVAGIIGVRPVEDDNEYDDARRLLRSDWLSAHDQQVVREHAQTVVETMREEFGKEIVRLQVKVIEAWDEGYLHGYRVGAEEGARGVVVEFDAPNPYRGRS